MTPEVQVALITTVGTVVTAAFGVLVAWLRRELKGIKQDTAVTKEQVTNSHDENLRVEMTRQFDAVHVRFDRQAQSIRQGAVELKALKTRFDDHVDGGAV